MEQLTTEKRLAWPSWSPHGRGLAFVDHNRDRLGVLDLLTRRIRWLDLDQCAVPVGRSVLRRARDSQKVAPEAGNV